MAIAANCQVRIVADDLTGAADAAAPFASAARPAHVAMNVPQGALPDIVSFDCDTRDAGPDVATARISAIARRLADEAPADRLLYQKIDSLGRGHVARDIALSIEAIGSLERAVVVPAYPAHGRSFEDGVIVDETGATGPALAPAFAEHGLDAAIVRADGERPVAHAIAAAFESGARVVLPDARSEADLAAIAAFHDTAPEGTLFAGSAGLTEAFAGRKASPEALARGRRVAFVIGTRSPHTRAQVERIETRADARHIALRPEEWARGAGDLDRLIADTATGAPLAIFELGESGGDAALVRDAVSAMVARLWPALAGVDLLLLSGGDTARAFLDRAGIDFFEVVGAFEPGVAVCRTPGHDLSFITKSGGFGDPDLFVRLVGAALPAGETP